MSAQVLNVYIPALPIFMKLFSHFYDRSKSNMLKLELASTDECLLTQHKNIKV